MTQIQLRRGTASEWSAANPVLAAGEVGVIGTTGDFKIGDGATTWNLLPAQSSRYVAAPTAWTAITLLNGWVAYDVAHTPQYRKIGDDVQLRGQVKSGSGALCTLPAGHNPAMEETFVVLSNGVLAYVSVANNGTITTNGSNVYVALSGIRFSTIA